MNIVTFEPSLYQLTQDIDEPLVSLSVGAETLKFYVNSVIKLLIQKQLKATVWVKLPQTKSWHEQILELQNEGNARRIFICTTQKNRSTVSFWNNTPNKTPIIPIELNHNPILQRECFLIAISENFCSSILAQWQKGKIQIESSGKRLQRPYLQMVSSFSPQEVSTVLSGIRQNMVSPQELAEENFKIAPNLNIRTDLLNELILKQITQQEKTQTAIKISPKISQVSESNSTILGLQDDFFNKLVQELRSPITHMKTALSLLESKQIKGEQRQRYLEMVSQQCERQNSLIGGLLELLQLNTPAEAEYLYLDDIVPGIVSTYQPLAEENQIQLGYTIPADLPPISCPRSWFRQIIINLLNNSLQFTLPKGRVFVQATLKSQAEYIEILVMDTGQGISHKEINKIFDGFYRTQPTTNRRGTGAGLGLTLVRQLVQRAGGSISVNSKVNKGTTFKILMPAVPRELIERRPPGA